MGYNHVELFRGLLEMLGHPFEDVCIRKSMGAVFPERYESFALGLGDGIGVNLWRKG